MTTTRKGDELAWKLVDAIGATYGIRETCARICRAATSLHRINEDECNGHPANSDPFMPIERVTKLQERWEARCERDSARYLRLLDSAVRDLPETDLGPWKLVAEEDPRGCSVIVAPEGVKVAADSWGEHNGVCIPR